MNDVIFNVFITVHIKHLEETLHIPARVVLFVVNKICISFLSLFRKLTKVESVINPTLQCGKVIENYC